MQDKLLDEVHKLANQKFYESYPLFDMGDVSKHSEGHITKKEVEYVLEAYEEIKK